jgi:prepilin-type processing-associated H-X9-DG protein
MILLAVMAAVALMILPRLTRPTGCSHRIRCVNNLKQVGLSFRQWAMDYGDKYPMAVSVASGGTMDHPLAYEPWVHLRLLSNELNTPKVLACPEDSRVIEGDSFYTNFGKRNVSYFVSLDAEEVRPTMILTGDRHLVTNGAPVFPGLHTIRPTDKHTWRTGLHNEYGNIGLADGSVRQFTSADLHQYLSGNPQTNRLTIP